MSWRAPGGFKNPLHLDRFMVQYPGDLLGDKDVGTGWILDIDEHYVRLCEAGDPLKKLNTLVPWKVFRKPLAEALKRQGRRAVLRFRAHLQDHGASSSLWAVQRPEDMAEFQIQNQLFFTRFIDPGDENVRLKKRAQAHWHSAEAEGADLGAQFRECLPDLLVARVQTHNQ